MPMYSSPSSPGSVTGAQKLYNAWVYDLVDEPLPELCNFIFDRHGSSQLVNFSIGGVRVQKHISCKGFILKIQNTRN